MKKTVIAVSIALSGCASFPQFNYFATKQKASSYVVQEINAADSEQLTQDMVQFLEKKLPPAKTILAVETSYSRFHEMLVEKLARRGFGVTQTMSAGAVPVRYYVTLFEGGMLVRIKYQDGMASRFYNRLPEGKLSFASLYSVLETSK